jgi:hypothetical protein
MLAAAAMVGLRRGDPMNQSRAVRSANGPIRLGASGRMTVYVIAAGVWITGVLWLVFHHFLLRPTEFGVEPHPLEIWWIRLHGAFTFGALWLIGFLSAQHIVSGWASRRCRLSGVTLLSVAALLTLTGYLIYYLGNEDLRRLASGLHWGVGLVAPGLFLWHRLTVFRRSDARPRAWRPPRGRAFTPGADIQASTHPGTRGAR